MKKKGDEKGKKSKELHNSTVTNKQSKESSRTSEERSRLLSEAAEEGIAIHDEGVIIEANEALARMFGYDLSEMIGKYVKNGATPESWEIISNNIAEGYDKPYEVTCVRKNGSTFVCSMVGKPYKYKDRTLRVSIFRDVTERKRMEEALRTSEEKYREFVKYAPVGIYEVDYETGRLKSVNDILCEYAEYTRDELLNMNFYNLFTEESQKSMGERLEKLRAGEKILPIVEYCIRTKKGKEIWIRLDVRYIYDRDKLQGATGIVHNITERKLAEESAQRSEEKYRNILENMQEGYFETDFKGDFTFFNDVTCQHFGYSREELMHINSRQYTDEETSKKLFHICEKIYKTGEPLRDFNWQIIRKDGTKRNIEGSMFLLQDLSGKPKGFKGLVRDITESKRADKLLKESEAQYHLLADHTKDQIWLLDLDLNVTYISPSVEKVSGYTPDEIKKMPLDKLLTKASLKSALEVHSIEMSKALSNQTPPSYTRSLEFEFRHKDGHIFPVEATLSFILDENGKPLSIMGESRDITERKKAEETIKQSEEKYRTILENMQEGYWEVDLKGNYTFFNDVICKQLGYTRKELMGINSLSSSDEETSKRLFHICKNIYKTGDPSRDLSWQITRKDGSRRDIEGSLFLLQGSSGKPKGFKGIAHDITESKKADISLRQSEEKYRLLADHMKDQVWIMDMNLKVSYVSPSVEKLLGYTAEELKNLPLDKLLTSESFQTAMNFISDELSKALAASSDYILNRTLELQFYCKDGQTVWGESMFSFIRDENGKPVSILGEGRIITERRQMEDALRKSEENFRRSLDDSPLGVRISTIEGKTLYANRAILDIYGYENVEELENTPLQERYTPETYIEFQIRKKKRLRGELGPSEYEVSIVRKNGEMRHLYVFRKEIFWNGQKQSQVIYQDITLRRQAEEKLSAILENLRQSIKITIQVLGTAAEARDPYMAGHQKRVADLARAIATEMKLPHDKIEAIRMAGAIHDIGKISVPSEILCKPAILSDLEFSFIKNHPQYSYDIIKEVESPWPLADIVHQHHERIDGSGYPQGLKNEDILIESRILAVADVVEAMVSYRPYRPALELEIALTEIENNAGILYDRNASDACLRLFREKGYQISS